MRTDRDATLTPLIRPVLPVNTQPRRPAALPLRPDAIQLERTIDFRKLRYFVQIVAEGSFSTAALRLRVAQPALSHHIRELEAVLGVPLLRRSAHGVVPTEAGSLLYDHGVAILAQVRQAAAEITSLHGGARKPVELGLPGFLAAVLVPSLVETVCRADRSVELRIREGTNGDLLNPLEEGQLDFALLYDAPDLKKLAFDPLLTETLYLVGPRGSGQAEIPFCELGALPLILPARSHGLRERLERQAAASALQLDVRIEVDSLANIKKLVAGGAGHSVLPYSQIREECRSGQLERRLIVEPRLQQTLSLCVLKGRSLTRSSALVGQITRQLIGELIAHQHWSDALLEEQPLRQTSG